MNKMSIGVDIIDVEQMDHILATKGPTFLNKVFTVNEISYCQNQPKPSQHFAARFAAKEALMKALETGWNTGIQWKQIEVTKNELGAPQLNLKGKAQQRLLESGFTSSSLSLSHSPTSALATVILY